MKKQKLLITTLCLYVFTAVGIAQYYQIAFTGSGESTTINSIEVLNLNQNTTITLGGNDTLVLTNTITGTDQLLFEDHDLRVYPNPSAEIVKMEFYNKNEGLVKIEVTDISGKRVMESYDVLETGTHTYEISGLNTGIYLINVQTTDQNFTGKIFSNGESRRQKSISYLGLVSNSTIASGRKSSQNIVEMQYNAGELILSICRGGNYSRVLTLVPTHNQTVNFEFVACTDVDGNHYPVVTIGTQLWMAENLKYLPSVTVPAAGSATTPSYYVYGYDGTVVADAKATSNYKTFGVLYNWPAAMNGATSSTTNPSGVQGICPTGWHLPSDTEWTQLTDYLGGGVAGGKLKETGTSHWNNPNNGATNETGFTALPGGYFNNYGTFLYVGNVGFWWSATENPSKHPWVRGIDSSASSVTSYTTIKEVGFSVRCVKD